HRHVRARARRAAAARALPRRAGEPQGGAPAAARRHRGAAHRDPGLREAGEKAAEALMALEYPFPEVPAPGTMQRVAPGVHWLSMPLPFQLNHINLWALEDRDGWTLVDTGIGSDETRALWE